MSWSLAAIWYAFRPGESPPWAGWPSPSPARPADPRGQILPGQRLGIDLDPHGRLLAAADEDLADAVDLRDLLGQHAVGGVEHLRERQRPRLQRQDQDRRVGRVDLAVVRQARQVGGQLATGGVDGGLDVTRRRHHVAVEVELHASPWSSRAR